MNTGKAGYSEMPMDTDKKKKNPREKPALSTQRTRKGQPNKKENVSTITTLLQTNTIDSCRPTCLPHPQPRLSAGKVPRVPPPPGGVREGQVGTLDF